MIAKPDRSSPADRHVWEFRWVRDLAILLVVLLLLWAAYSIRSITAPIVIGFGLAYVFNPLVNWASRWRGVPRWASTAAVMFAAAAAVIGLAVYTFPTLSDQIEAMVKALTKFLQTNDTVQSLWRGFTAKVTELTESAQELDSAALQPVLDELSNFNLASVGRFLLNSLDVGFGAVGSLISTTMYLVLMAVIVGFCFFFFSWKFPAITGWFKPLLPVSHRDRTLEVIGLMDRSVAAFVRGRLIQALVMGLLLSVGWWLAGVPYFLLLGMGCGLLNLVPYAAVAGCLIAVGLSCIHALAGMVPDEGLAAAQMAMEAATETPTPEQGALEATRAPFPWAVVIWPLVVYIIVQLIDGWAVEPLVQGKATDLDPLTVLLVVMVGGALAGLLGMLLAIPVAACVKILLREVILPEWRAYAERRT